MNFFLFVYPRYAPPLSKIHLDVFSDEALSAPPDVSADGIRSAEHIASLGPKHWRYSYVTHPEDTGSFVVRYEAVGVNGEVTITGQFRPAVDAGIGSRFGVEAVSPSPVGSGFAYPIEQSSPVDPYLVLKDSFAIRRGYEGPQLILTWSNSDAILCVIARSLLTEPTVNADLTVGPGTEYVYIGTDESFVDLWVKDGEVYYYTIYALDVGSSTLTPIASVQSLALDNQGLPSAVATEIEVLGVQLTAPPVDYTPTVGDSFLVAEIPVVPPGTPIADGVFLGHDGEIATWNGTDWEFSAQVDRALIYNHGTYLPASPVTNHYEAGYYIKRLLKWAPYVDRDRVRLYDHLTTYDHVQDAKSESSSLVVEQDSTLDGEIFNFDESDRSQLTEERLLKLFELPLNELRGLVEYFSRHYDVARVDSRYLPRLAAAVGFDELDGMSTDVRRFLIQNISNIYPLAGMSSLVSHAVSMWLGTDQTFDLKRWNERMLVVGSGRLARVTENTDHLGLETDQAHYVPSLDPESHINHRGLQLFLPVGVEFTPRAVLAPMVTADTIDSATITSPPELTVDTPFALYIIPPGSTGAWFGLDGLLAFWNIHHDDFPDGHWDYWTPSHLDSFVAQDTGVRWVYWANNAYRGQWVPVSDLSKLHTLSTWLERYVLPGTVKLKISSETGDLWTDDRERIEDAPYGDFAATGYRGVLGQWENSENSDPGYCGPWQVVDGEGALAGETKILSTNFGGSLPTIVGSDPTIHGARIFGIPSFHYPSNTVSVYVKIPASYLTSDLYLGAGDFALWAVNLVRSMGGALFANAIYADSNGDRTKFRLRILLPGGASSESDYFPAEDLADGEWHKLTSTHVPETGILTLTLETGGGDITVVHDTGFTTLRFPMLGLAVWGSIIDPQANVPDWFVSGIRAGQILP